MIFGGLLVLLFAVSEFIARINTDIDGVVMSSVLKCVEPAHYRCVRTYTLISLTSGALFTYAAGPNDESLPQSIPNGAHIIKKKGKLSYTINGRTSLGFPLWFYSGLITVGGWCFLGGIIAGCRWFSSFCKGLDDQEEDTTGLSS